MSDTVKEHYIPQFYLRNFSPNNKRIYQYRINSNASSKLVPIESICCKEYLYEYRNENGNIIAKNLIENSLAIFEGYFCNTIKSIVSKSKAESNYQIPCFLSNDEKCS